MKIAQQKCYNYLIQNSEYPPFGMTLPKRNFEGGIGYRYSFNGKEKDPEGLGGSGATYDYGFRIYNPNIARFLSVDPLTKSYPWYTPYQFAGNKPIVAIDLDGLEEVIVVKSFTKANNGQTQILEKTTERRVGALPWKKVVGYEFTINNGKKYTANSNQTTYGRDGRGVKPGQEGNFSGVYTLTKDDLVTLFSYGLNVIDEYNSIDDAYKEESVGTGARLDFKFTLYSVLKVENNMLIEINGTTYNANEAGNFIWSALNEYADEVTDMTAIYDPSAAAQWKTMRGQGRFDEPHEQKACDDGENYGIKLSDDMNFNQEVHNKVKNKNLFDKSYVKDK